MSRDPRNLLATAGTIARRLPGCKPFDRNGFRSDGGTSPGPRAPIPTAPGTLARPLHLEGTDSASVAINGRGSPTPRATPRRQGVRDMRHRLRNLALAGLLAAGGLATIGTSSADAQGFGVYPGDYGGGFPGGGYGYGYGAPGLSVSLYRAPRVVGYGYGGYGRGYGGYGYGRGYGGYDSGHDDSHHHHHHHHHGCGHGY